MIDHTKQADRIEIGESDFFVTSHFERDNASVWLWMKVDQDETPVGEPVVQWIDDDCRQAFEDGFLDPRDHLGSAFEYAESHRLIDAISERAKAVYLNVAPVAERIARTEILSDIDSGFADVEPRLPEDLRREYGTLPTSVKYLISDDVEEILGETVGWQIADAGGSSIMGTEDDPFAEHSFSILIGDAIKEARRWVDAHEGFTMLRIGPDDVEEPEYVAEVTARAFAPRP